MTRPLCSKIFCLIAFPAMVAYNLQRDLTAVILGSFTVVPLVTFNQLSNESDVVASVLFAFIKIAFSFMVNKYELQKN